MPVFFFTSSCLFCSASVRNPLKWLCNRWRRFMINFLNGKCSTIVECFFNVSGKYIFYKLYQYEYNELVVHLQHLYIDKTWFLIMIYRYMSKNSKIWFQFDDIYRCLCSLEIHVNQFHKSPLCKFEMAHLTNWNVHTNVWFQHILETQQPVHQFKHPLQTVNTSRTLHVSCLVSICLQPQKILPCLYLVYIKTTCHLSWWETSPEKGHHLQLSCHVQLQDVSVIMSHYGSMGMVYLPAWISWLIFIVNAGK